MHIGADGRVTCLVGKIEMGQGTMTSLPQLVAEELNVPLTSVDIVMGDTDVCPWDMGTFGSLSIRQFGPVLRAAAAEARAMLVAMAADRLQVAAASLEVTDGVVRSTADPTKRVSYAELTAGKRIERRLESKAAVEPVSAYTVVGKSAPRRDGHDKVTGKAKYAGDIVPKDALHARILRVPAHGATIAQADTSAAAAVPGVQVDPRRRPRGRAAPAPRRGRPRARPGEGDLHEVAQHGEQRDALRPPREDRARGPRRRRGRQPRRGREAAPRRSSTRST